MLGIESSKYQKDYLHDRLKRESSENRHGKNSDLFHAMLVKKGVLRDRFAAFTHSASVRVLFRSITLLG